MSKTIHKLRAMSREEICRRYNNCCYFCCAFDDDRLQCGKAGAEKPGKLPNGKYILIETETVEKPKSKRHKCKLVNRHLYCITHLCSRCKFCSGTTCHLPNVEYVLIEVKE